MESTGCSTFPVILPSLKVEKNHTVIKQLPRFFLGFNILGDSIIVFKDKRFLNTL